MKVALTSSSIDQNRRGGKLLLQTSFSGLIQYGRIH